MRPRRCLSIPFYHLFISVPPVRRNRGATLFANFSPDPSLFHARQKASQEYEADFFTDESHVLILLSAMERCERRWGWNFFPPRPIRRPSKVSQPWNTRLRSSVPRFHETDYREVQIQVCTLFGSSSVIVWITTKSYSLKDEIKNRR